MIAIGEVIEEILLLGHPVGPAKVTLVTVNHLLEVLHRLPDALSIAIDVTTIAMIVDETVVEVVATIAGEIIETENIGGRVPILRNRCLLPYDYTSIDKTLREMHEKFVFRDCRIRGLMWLIRH